MPNVYFISDTHFGHKNIIEYANRPFSSVEEMDETMVTRWNAKVKPQDEVYHLGDFSFYDGRKVFHRLNGRKHLIVGNHDNEKTLQLPWASAPRHYKVINVNIPIGETVDTHRVVLFHYPIEEWAGQFKNRALHLFGHVHGKPLKPCEFTRFDMSVECWNYTPVTLEEILESKNNGT